MADHPVPDMPATSPTPWLAYVFLWFPYPTETFLFREIVQLHALGLPVMVYTLYGDKRENFSAEMLAYKGPVQRMGTRAFFSMVGAFSRALIRHPLLVGRLLREGFFRRMRDVEAQCENLWAFLAGFLLAERCRKAKIRLLHAPWANGPATAAWVASRLTGIPFVFTGRAGDMYPQDGLLYEKARDALAIRTNNAANVDWLAKFCPEGQKDKIHLIYNALTINRSNHCAVAMQPPYRLLSVGRMVPKKGFDILFTAIARLRREGVPVHLTIVGDGFLRQHLQGLRQRLGLEEYIDMPGFVAHDKVHEYAEQSDILVVPSVIDGENGNRDGIPNVIMEALTQRLPVVATDVCGIGEVVRDGETGLLVPPRDAAALANAIREMCQDRAKAIAMAEAGCRLVGELFDQQRNTRALCTLYQQTLTRAESRHAA